MVSQGQGGSLPASICCGIPSGTCNRPALAPKSVRFKRQFLLPTYKVCFPLLHHGAGSAHAGPLPLELHWALPSETNFLLRCGPVVTPYNRSQSCLQDTTECILGYPNGTWSSLPLSQHPFPGNILSWLVYITGCEEILEGLQLKSPQ